MSPTQDINDNSLCLEVEKDIFDPKAKFTNRERKRELRRRQKVVLVGQPPKNADDKYIEKIGTFTMHQLIRRLKQAARYASKFKHLEASVPNQPKAAMEFRRMHNHALMCYSRLKVEIEFRVAPREEL